MADSHASRLEFLFATAHPVALVTGSGAPRIGNQIARSLAVRGYRLVVHGHRSVDQAEQTVDELRAAGHEAIVEIADLTDELAVKEMISHAHQAFGRLDALVNCASIWTKKPLEEVTADDLRRDFDANVLSTFLCCQQAGLVMVDQPTGGAIVNLGDWAIGRPYLDYSAYFASKGSIPTLTRDFAHELAARNPQVRVNAILPGPVMLPANLSESQRSAAIKATLLKREGSPCNIADAAVFLIENDFVTGVCLPVDGGRSIYAPD
ncbi:MAG TPA: SDR family oxidoreductase [Pirellulaceae bacterium]|jgi:pteridine reductase|nr:SDR family oxidoreductase [Pirellulaceae bacterium]